MLTTEQQLAIFGYLKELSDQYELSYNTASTTNDKSTFLSKSNAIFHVRKDLMQFFADEVIQINAFNIGDTIFSVERINGVLAIVPKIIESVTFVKFDSEQKQTEEVTYTTTRCTKILEQNNQLIFRTIQEALDGYNNIHVNKKE